MIIIINIIVYIVQSAVQTKSVTWPFCSMNISCVLERVISGLDFSPSVQVSILSYNPESISNFHIYQNNTTLTKNNQLICVYLICSTHSIQLKSQLELHDKSYFNSDYDFRFSQLSQHNCLRYLPAGYSS